MHRLIKNKKKYSLYFIYLYFIYNSNLFNKKHTLVTVIKNKKKQTPLCHLFMGIDQQSDCHDAANVLARACRAKIGFYKTGRAFEFGHK